MNPPLPRHDPHTGYRFSTLGDEAEQRAQDETFIVLTLSGGGTRAAAFAYGALEALNETYIGRDRTLLGEVDVISSVSGGSFAAAYLGLFGQEAFFRKFPYDVLHRKIERDLIVETLKPWNWLKLLSPYYGRGDLADGYYDSHIFQGKKFSDLRRHRPFIILNATDIGRGTQFSFTQDTFDRICSDLDQVSVSRGVTASSAFPVAFTPLTVRNYGLRECRYEPPAWVSLAEQGGPDTSPGRYALALTWRSYEDTGSRPYIHLSDGGLADNIGLRAVETVGSDDQAAPNSLGMWTKINRRRIKRLVIIVVDAKPHSDLAADQSSRPPDTYTVLNAAATTPMEHYSSDTIEIARLKVEHWNREVDDFKARKQGCDTLAGQLCAGAPNREACEDARRDQCYATFHTREIDKPPTVGVPFYLIHVRFEAIPNSDVKRRLQLVNTRLQLPDDQVNLLITWGHRLLAESPTFQQLLDDLRGGVTPPGGSAETTGR